MFNNNGLSGRPITSTQWSTNHSINENEFSLQSMRNRFNSLSINGSDDESVVSVVGNSPNASSFGSPVKFSPFNWSESVYSSHSSDENQLNYQKWSSLETERINSKSEFNKNGIEVPILKSNVWKGMDINNNMNADLGNTYELFGKNRFTYANVESSVVTPLTANESIIGLKAKQRRRQKTQMYCAFCKNNNETPLMYSSHILKDPTGRTVCPVLRKYDCPICKSGGGDTAHTIRFCPRNKAGQHIPSVIKILKNSRSADGKKRTN